MTNEYLFQDDPHRAEVESYKPDGIAVKISEIEGSPLWIATYKINGKNEDSARKMSEVHQTIMGYSPLVLSCESSAYYNKILFPLVNELERKLRYLLYLAVSISDNADAQQHISLLEEKDFGQIFDLLFTDQEFVKTVKSRVNAESKGEFSGRSKYSKKEILLYVNSLDEHTLWDAIFRESNVPTLRDQFRDVQTYRNDVMHAHNISKETFNKSRNVFNKINKELDNAICEQKSVIKEIPSAQKEKVSVAISVALAQTSLSAALKSYMDKSVLSDAIRAYYPRQEDLENLQLLNKNSAFEDTFKHYALQNAILKATYMENERDTALRLSELIQKNEKLVEEFRKPLSTLPPSAWESIQRHIGPDGTLPSDQVKNLSGQSDTVRDDQSHSNQNIEGTADKDNEAKGSKANEADCKSTQDDDPGK